MTIHFNCSGFNAEWVIAPGSLLVRRIWAEAHPYQSSTVSNPEEQRKNWVNSQLEMVSATLDEDISLEWQVDNVEWPPSVDDFGMNKKPIKICFSTSWNNINHGTHQLFFHKDYLEKISVTWFYLYGEQGVRFYPPKQKKGEIRIRVVIPDKDNKTSLETQKDKSRLLESWESGTPSLPGFVENLGRKIAEQGGASIKQPQKRGAQAILTAFMQSSKVSVGFYLAAFGIALVLGALHAVTPGHGKSIMAAYLVGAHGKYHHALALGCIVTFTHTGSVFLLGVVTLVASHYIMPERLFPILQISSGILIVLFGLYFLRQRWRVWQQGRKKSKEDSSSVTEVPEQINWRTMVVLGVSSGLVPCPAATTILLTAVSINRIILGLALIASFSIGLASTLIGIGITMVQGRRWFDRIKGFGRLVPVMPVVSAFILLFLGIALTVNAIRISFLILPTARQSAAPALQQDNILYLSFDEKRQRQIFMFSLEKNESLCLTSEQGTILDYSLSPDNTLIAYTLLNKDSSSEIYMIHIDGTNRRLLLSEERASFSRPVWAPGGAVIVYEKMDYNVSSAIAAPSLWWIDPKTGEKGPLFQDTQLPCRYPSWSFDGEWLSYSSYFSASQKSLLLYNLKDGSRVQVPSKPQGFVSWKPDERKFLYTELRPYGYNIKPTAEQRFDRRLLIYDANTQDSVDICTEKRINDTFGSWSPDGSWMVVIRRELDARDPKMSTQIWLMRPDGSQARRLTKIPGVNFGTPVWSLDATYLLFTMWSKAKLSTTAELWLMEIDTGKRRLIASRASWPQWLSDAKSIVEDSSEKKIAAE